VQITTGDGLVDRIVSGFVDMKCLCCLLQVISFKSFVVCACFVEGLNSKCNEFCLLFFNGFWKWRALPRLKRIGLWRGWGTP
jgi:hypothetical protein